ncbi:MAG: hypothetical protein COV29_03250 [Candidatus Yanofskybacteria bacterium CG10_big_fil_rev_8_21_14_0_10_36_16]|uniref:Aromatic ring-opening dioxygenase LigA n=1 Tax=Candidatus Yanofskybacteria bacterium CG10_big_fil_rev_8_21_14_0_10_36_16 TaxID=1975096 RepID=A0A2J0QAM7_9BACT|nr:MAG: hypothetical protein COV29_03250 [Candidatus Yanofskybacteria bacterium CG10_big_fil_rev_8_21_14_0_10_36_16]
MSVGMNKILKTSGVLAIIAGIVMITFGIWGIVFTYKNVARENIITPSDASIPEKPVRGPFTLKAQADIIREHALNSTGGLTYAEMPRQIAKVDENGKTVLDDNGEPVMVSNEARNIWVTATTLTTALNLGIITYAFSGLVLLLGLISVWTGITFYSLYERKIR